MTINDVVSLFRTYIDEPDQTFIDDDKVKTMLTVGYKEFKRKVTNIDPNTYARTIDVPMNSLRVIDLIAAGIAGFAQPPVPMYGPAAAAVDALSSLISIYTKGANGAPATVFNAVHSLEALQSTPQGYLFSGPQIQFLGTLSDTVTIYYVAESFYSPEPDFTAGTANQHFDDLDAFHDMIPLYAYKQYAIADAATSEQIIIQLRAREGELIDYLSNRNTAGARYVQDVTSGEFWL